MNDRSHTILCVDDEENILNSLKRLLRREPYRLLTARNGAEGLKIFEQNQVHLVITDQRMPGMSGIEFLAKVRAKYPDVLRIILTGYTDVDSITESINKGHIYKFFLKPWNDQTLKLEIKQALEQYDLIKANKGLHEEVLKKNQALKRINENLEKRVQERTKTLEVQNQALEISRAILEDLPVPIIGLSIEGTIVFINQQAQYLPVNGQGVEIGRSFNDYFSPDMQGIIASVFSSNLRQRVSNYRISGVAHHIDLTPLSGRFRGKGVIMTLNPMGK